MKRHNSQILAVSSDSVNLATVGMIDGFIPFGENADGFPFEVNDVWIGPRDVLETNDNYRQIIPYVLVERDQKYLLYKRTPKGGESRLHNKLSLGFGGHIDVSDISITEDGQSIDLEGAVGNAVVREIQEELSSDIISFEALGIIALSGNLTDRVHVGILMLASTNSMVVSKEDQIDLVGFKSLEEIAEIIADENNDLENWSKIAFNQLLLQNGLA
jgi:predicted NUDIX family phosphoesterase